jgi:hypothetical protein
MFTDRKGFMRSIVVLAESTQYEPYYLKCRACGKPLFVEGNHLLTEKKRRIGYCGCMNGLGRRPAKYDAALQSRIDAVVARAAE